MAAYTGSEPVLVDQTFGLLRAPSKLTSVDGGILDATRMAENGIPIGRYPGITLRNAHLQYIVTW
jgi:cytochrome oxidase assembly protein ShyY1